MLCLGFPQGFINLIRGFYCPNVARCPLSGFLLFWYLSGILQGDPLLGLLFKLAVNIFFRHAFHNVEGAGLGVVRSCADDLGALLYDWQDLAVLKEPMDAAAKIKAPGAPPR